MISLQGADGLTHNFPDDTPKDVIDRVMGDVGDKYQQWARKTVSAENKNGAEGYLPDVMQGSQRKILQGLTGNFADDALAYGHAAIDPILGKGANLPFSERLKYEKARQNEYNRVADEKSGTTGDIAGGLASALGISRLGKAGMTLMPETAEGLTGLGKTMLAGAGEGAGYGALYGAGEGDGLDDKASKAITGGLGGGVFGAALPAVLAGAKKAAAQPISNLIAARNPEEYAASQYANAINNSGQSIDDVMGQVNNANAAGVPLNIADATGKSGQRLLYAAASAEGPGRDIATRTLNDRQAGQSERIGHLLDEALGADRTGRQAGQEFMQQAAENSRPLYAASDAYPIQWNQNIEKFIQDPIAQRAFRKGIAIQRMEALAQDPNAFNARDFSAAGYNAAASAPDVIAAGPNMRSLDAIKKGLDNIIEGYRDKTTGRLQLDEYGRAVDQVRRRFIQELDQVNPRYAEARAAWAGPAAQNEAIGLGKQMAQGGRYADNIDTFNRLNDAQKVGARIGYADSKAAGLERSTEGRNNANSLITPKTQNELEAMSLYQGPRQPGAPNEIRRRLDWENTMNQTRNQALMGSRTAENMADQKTSGVDARLMGALKSFATMHPVQGAAELFGAAGNLYGGNTAAVREQLARIGLSNGNVDLTELLRRANAKGVRGRKIERQALQGLLGGGAASIGGLQ